MRDGWYDDWKMQGNQQVGVSFHLYCFVCFPLCSFFWCCLYPFGVSLPLPLSIALVCINPSYVPPFGPVCVKARTNLGRLVAWIVYWLNLVTRANSPNIASNVWMNSNCKFTLYSETIAFSITQQCCLWFIAFRHALDPPKNQNN